MHPVQRDCDPNDPKQHAAWCWAAGIPDPSPSRPVPIPLIGPMLVEGVSQMLWDFGFRHHPELQTQWIDGTAGLGMVANLVEKEPEDDFVNQAQQFLAANNPEAWAALQSNEPGAREKVLQDLRKNLEQLSALVDSLKEK